MPISVTCGSCAASFSVKDEYAGKRAKCPKCAEPLTVPPAAPPVAAPVVARPVVAARVPPKPAGEGEPKRRRADEDDTPKRKRGADAEDERPQRKRGDDDAEEKPHSRRRRRDDDDDDEPKKKSKALPIILGVVGGLLLLCGGGCAGVWVFVVNPAIEQAKVRVSEKQAELNRIEQRERNPSPPTAPEEGAATEANLRKVKVGMTEEQVRKILGSSISAVESDVTDATATQGNPADARARWRVKLNAGCVLSYRGEFTHQALVAYSARPEDGGTAVATLGTFAGQGVEPIRLSGDAPPTDQPLTLTADQLSDRMAELKDKTVIVTGKVEFASNATQGGSITLARSRGKKSVGMAFTAAKWNAEWAGKKMQPGDGVTIKGVVGVDPTGVSVLVKDCELVSHTPGGVKTEDRTPVAILTPDELALNYAQMKDKWITLKAQYKSTPGGETGSVTLIAPTGKTMVVHPSIGTKFAFKTPPQPFDNLEFTGKVAGSDRIMILGDATLLSQSASTEKPLELTAEELTAEFDKDAAAAAKKYEGKLLKVTGTVNAGGNTGAHLGLRGLEVKPPGGKIKAYFVDCLFEGTARDAAKGVKLSEKATIVGRFGGFKKGSGETYTVTLTTSRLDK